MKSQVMHCDFFLFLIYIAKNSVDAELLSCSIMGIFDDSI